MTLPDSGSSSGPRVGSEAGAHELPLLPLVDAVCFPRTEMRLHVSDRNRYRFLRGLFAEHGDQARLGIVLGKEAGDPKALAPLLRPVGSVRSFASAPAAEADRPSAVSVFAEGALARLIRLEPLPGGCEVLLWGETRIQLEREMTIELGHRARIVTLEEPEISETDPDVLGLRKELLSLVDRLAEDCDWGFGSAIEEWNRSRSTLPFEVVVNRLASGLDLPPMRKLQLLRDPLPDRALHLLTLLRGRSQVLDLLRPFRHLALGAERN